MSARIVKRSMGDVTALDVSGRITLGEGAVYLRDVLRELVASGRKKIILNIPDVQYIDSSGFGELISGFTTVVNNGGQLVLMHPTKRVRDLMQITKCYTIFQLFDDETGAVQYLESSPLHCLCPICGSIAGPPLWEDSKWQPQTCGNATCRTQFTLFDSPDRPGGELVERVEAPTYSGEYVEILAGKPFRVRIAGRLNLFTSSALLRTWKALPQHSTALIDLQLSTEISDEGRAALLRLVDHPPNGNVEYAAITLEGLGSEVAVRFQETAKVFLTTAAALAEIGRFASEKQGLNCRWPAHFGRPHTAANGSA